MLTDSCRGSCSTCFCKVKACVKSQPPTFLQAAMAYSAKNWLKSAKPTQSLPGRSSSSISRNGSRSSSKNSSSNRSSSSSSSSSRNCIAAANDACSSYDIIHTRSASRGPRGSASWSAPPFPRSTHPKRASTAQTGAARSTSGEPQEGILRLDGSCLTWGFFIFLSFIYFIFIFFWGGGGGGGLGGGGFRTPGL